MNRLERTRGTLYAVQEIFSLQVFSNFMLKLHITKENYKWILIKLFIKNYVRT